ncbi:MAG: hypothetical protein F4085_04925 [Acidimicrobiia bacterium]|nr:hypothetical protein [Acidimicrobiia bacterium]
MKVTPSTWSLCARRSPASSPPVITCRAPEGSPARAKMSASSKEPSAPVLDGLSTTVFPVKRAADVGLDTRATGKLKGEMIAHTPHGLSTEWLVSPTP